MPKYSFDDLMDIAMEFMGIGEYVQWPVVKGNGVVLMTMVERTVRRARPGDRLLVKGGGFVEKLEADSWVQWKFYGAGDDAPPLTGRVLNSAPAVAVTGPSPVPENSAAH